MAKTQDVTTLIDRLEATEDTCGVTLASLNAVFHDDSDDPFDLSKVTIGGEAYFSGSLGIYLDLPHREYVTIFAVIYDELNRVVATNSTIIGEGNSPFDVFLLEIEGYYPAISKIRIFVSR